MLPTPAIPPLLTALLYLAVACFVLTHAPKDKSKTFAYTLWMFATVYWQLGWTVVLSLQEPTWVPLIIRLNYSGIMFLPIAFYHLMVEFTESKKDLVWLKVAYGCGVLFLILCWTDFGIVGGFGRFSWGYYLIAGPLHPVYLGFLLVLAVRCVILLFSNDQYPSTQLKLLRWAFVLYIPSSIDFLVNYGVDLYPLGFAFTICSVALISYAIIRHQMFDVQWILQKALVYSAITVLLTTLYTALVVVAAKLFERSVSNPGFYTAAFAAAVVVVLSHPLRLRLQEWIDSRFPRESMNQTLLKEATGGFAHEIKRPLTAISLPVQLAMSDLDHFVERGLLKKEDAAAVNDRLRYVLKQSSEAADKIEAIHALALGEAVQKGEINLRAVLAKCLSNEASRIEREGILLNSEFKVDAALVRGNAIQLDVAFANLIRNAIDSMRSSKEKKLLSCTLTEKNKSFLISIQDTGAGIPPEALGKLFEPWFSTKGAHGMGIGLFITHQIILSHQGNIHVSSNLSQGSEFIVSLPRCM